MSVQAITVKAWFPLCRYRLSWYRIGSHCVGTGYHGKGLVTIVSVQIVTVKAWFPLSRHGKGLIPIASKYGHDFIVELIDKCIMQMKLHEQEVDIRLK